MSVKVDSIKSNSKDALKLAVAAACAGIPAAQVQAAIDEIVVTATKREADLQSVPIAVTAFGDEEIVRQRFKTFSDYVGQIPSLSVVERQPGATSVLMRGCATQGLTFTDSATTSVYLDEQPITAAGYNPDPRLVDIQRVEALGGPQGTLFGDAAQCGTLRIITNKPDANESSSWIDVSGMSVNGGGSGYDLSAMANIPLIEDKLALRLVGFVAEEPGWIDNVLSRSPGSDPALGVDSSENFTNAAFIGSDVNSANYYGGRVALRWNAAEDWTVDLNGIYQKYKLDGFADVDLNNTSPNDLSLFSNAVFPELGDYDQIRFGTDDWEDEWYQTSLTVEGNLGFADLVITGAYFDRESVYNADATTYLQAFQQLGDYLRSYYDPNMTIYDFNGDPQAQDFDARDTKSYSFEARLTSAEDSESRWNWLGGVFYNHREVKELFTSNVDGLWQGIAAYDTPGGAYLDYNFYIQHGANSPPSNNWFSGTYDSDLDQWAAFGEIGFDVTDNFSVTLGGRYYDIENEYTVVQSALQGVNGGIIDCAISYCYTGSNDTGTGKDDGFVPKVNATYQWEDKLVYFTYSEGFRRGGVNSARPQSIYGNVPGFMGDPAAGSYSDYDSDNVYNYEIGAKTEWLDNTLRLNITAYYMNWEDIQIQVEDTITGTFSLGVVNAPEAEIKGAEAWLAWAPNDTWDFTANFSYNKGELSKDFEFPADSGEVHASDGTDLPLMPNWKASVNAEYTFAGQLLDATPYILAQYVYWGDSVNSIGIESSNFAYPVKKQPSWQTLDLSFGLDGDQWSAVLYVDNVFDEYKKHFYNNRFSQQRLSVGQPRTIGAGFRFNFGD